MLIEFRVRNFRSIRDEQVLSMVANDDTELLETNTIETGLAEVPRLVRSAAIYGANASGKSNLIKAMMWMNWFIANSEKFDSNEGIDTYPFLFDEEVKKQSSLFEMTFILSGIQFRYGMEVTKERVITEYLFEYQNSEVKSWFEREFDPETGTYDFVSDLGEGDIEEFWRKSTKSTSLFLSCSDRFNIEKLKPIYFFHTKKIVFGVEKARYKIFHNISLDTHFSNPETMDEILKFLQSAGIHVENITKERRKISQTVPENNQDFDQIFKEILDFQFFHKTKQGSTPLYLRHESDGTQKLFYLSSILITLLKEGNIFIDDELDSSLHSHLVEWIIKLFHSPETNPHGAQLIFTTHNNSIMTEQNFRRDQIWFVDKNLDEASRVFPLSDFYKDDSLTLPQAYLEGRYGALPYLTDLKGE